MYLAATFYNLRPGVVTVSWFHKDGDYCFHLFIIFLIWVIEVKESWTNATIFIPNAAGLLYTLSFNKALFHLILFDKVYAFLYFYWEHKVIHSKIDVFLIFLIYFTFKIIFIGFISSISLGQCFLPFMEYILKIYNPYLVCMLCLYLKVERICQVLPNNRLCIISLIFFMVRVGMG